MALNMNSSQNQTLPCIRSGGMEEKNQEVYILVLRASLCGYASAGSHSTLPSLGLSFQGLERKLRKGRSASILTVLKTDSTNQPTHINHSEEMTLAGESCSRDYIVNIYISLRHVHLPGHRGTLPVLQQRLRPKGIPQPTCTMALPVR